METVHTPTHYTFDEAKKRFCVKDSILIHAHTLLDAAKVAMDECPELRSTKAGIALHNAIAKSEGA